MNDKKVVITGGAGFIGSNLARNLYKENKVIIIDDLSTGNLKNIQNLIDNNQIEFVKGSITDLDLLQEHFKDVDYVYHIAAIPSVPKSVKDPVKSNIANVDGTLNVLVAARNNEIKKVIYSSSSSVYGDTPKLPKKEDMIPCPLSPYAVGKLTGEYYCNVFTGVYNLPTLSLRYFNVYGPRQDPLGEYAAVIPKFITRINNNEPPIIYGDGEQSRDFTYVSDVVQANIKAVESSACGIFNVAVGNRITIRSLAEYIMEIIGKNVDIVYEDPRPGDVKHSLADITKAKTYFNYEPDFDIKSGLRETIKWFQK